MLLQMAELNSYLWLSSIPLYIHHIFFIHPSVDGHLDCFSIVAILNNAALNMGVHVSFWISVFIFFRYMPRNRIAVSYNCPIFSFLRKLHTVSHSGCTSLHPHQQRKRAPSARPGRICHLWSVWWQLFSSAMSWCLTALICISLMNSDVEHFCHMPASHLYVFFGRMPVQVF